MAARRVTLFIVPGDVQYNLGDIAICLATVRLVRQLIPDSKIAVWGRSPCFMQGFDGVRFYPRLGIGGLRDLLHARVVLWGGGQLLQGNRSRIKVPYWCARIALLRVLRKRIMGFAQGVGPLPRTLDRRLARFAVGCTEVFTVRDQESLKILEEIYVPRRKVFLTGDPALTLSPEARRESDKAAPLSRAPRLQKSLRPRHTFGVSLRYTCHHRSTRMIPFQFLPSSIRRRIFRSHDFCTYIDAMVHLWDRVFEELGPKITFVPMYYAPWETDEIIAELVMRRMKYKKHARIFRPSGGVDETCELLQTFDAFVGTPMHATLLATCRMVPTLALYYEPKGLDFFRRIEQQTWAFPVDEIWRQNGPDRLYGRIRALWFEKARVRADLQRTIPPLMRLAATNIDHLSTFLNRER